GTEHAVGHLLYARMWTKVLFDLGYVSFEEPFKKLVNQGMIQGKSAIVYRFVFDAVYYEDGVIKTNDSFPFDSIIISRGRYEDLNSRQVTSGTAITDYFENI